MFISLDQTYGVWVDTSPKTSVLSAFLSAILLIGLAPAAQSNHSAVPPKKVWLADVAAVLAPSVDYLDRRVEGLTRRERSRLAIVLDIDNTSLASHYNWPKPVRQTRKLARRAESHGVKVFFVTGRLSNDALKQAPVLKRAGYQVDGICGRRSGEGLAKGKIRCRKNLISRGYTLVASVGNRKTDFTGGLVERKFKLPSYNKALS